MNAGRTAFATDPTGVTVGLWQGKDRIGSTVVNEPGRPLAALRDPQGAAFSVWAFNGATT
ncbi:hypothetical protein [Streptomyces sp. 7N604]|uniref:hypothetical protein n=1 Tax=Streptomyces sp. 7N604 TaxID=3457415 RepID=UPI003FD52AA8